MADHNGEITLPRRPFTDVHELVYLFHSWQLTLEAGSIPEVLRPLLSMPPHLLPVMNAALAAAQAQLESSQAGTEISLRLPATAEMTDLMKWGSVQLAEIEGTLDEEVHGNWRRTLQLAKDLVDSALDELNALVVAD